MEKDFTNDETMDGASSGINYGVDMPAQLFSDAARSKIEQAAQQRKRGAGWLVDAVRQATAHWI